MVDGDAESFMLEGTSGDVQANVLLKAGSATGSEQVAQAFLQVGLEKLQGWTRHKSLGHLLQCLTVFIGRKIVFPCFS